MKKGVRRSLIALGVVLAIGCVPLPLQLKDGGTVTYNALLYRVVCWHQLTETEGVYKTGVEFHFFPRNFQDL